MNPDTRRIALLARIYETIEPFDVAGLGKRERHPWYPALAEDFLDAAHKLGASREDAAKALAAAGFAEPKERRASRRRPPPLRATPN